MARTFPTKGLSPIDAYTETGNRSLGYFEGTCVQTASGSYRSLEVITKYEPAGDSGRTGVMGLSSKVVLGESATFTGGQSAMWGVQAQLDFLTGATLDQASSIFAALRGVITKSGTPVFSAFDTVACLYCDNLCATNLAGIASTYGSALISLQNHGGTLDAGIIIRGGNKLSAMFKFVTCGGVINSSSVTGGTEKNITINIDGTDFYWNVYTG